MEESLALVSGVANFVSWFGSWPGFHDAEIVSLDLDRKGVSTLQIYTFEMTKEIDERGFFVHKRHVLVNFRMEEILSLTLSDFSEESVIFGLSLTPVAEGFKIDLDPCCGLSGTITAKRVSIDFVPIPKALR